MAKKLTEYELKWKVKNERILKFCPLVTVAGLLLAIEELRHSPNNTIIYIPLSALIVMSLLGSITGLIVRCQILEDKLLSLEERLR